MSEQQGKPDSKLGTDVPANDGAFVPPVTFYRIDEVAKFFHVSRRTFEGWLVGKTCYHRIGSRRLFSPENIQEIKTLMACPPAPPDPRPPKNVVSASPSEHATLEKLRKLTSPPKNKGRRPKR